MSERIAGTSYILNFYRDIILLTHYVATYMNLLAELDFKYSGVDLSKLSIEEKKLIMDTIQMVRYNANKCKIEYSSLRKKVSFEGVDDEQIQALSKKINSTDGFVIIKEDAAKFAELMNDLLVSDVIQHILETNQDLMQQLFGEDDKGQSQTGQSATNTF